MEQAVKAVTVEQLNTYIRDYLSGAPYLSHVTVKGELSNVRVYLRQCSYRDSFCRRMQLLPPHMPYGR